MRPVLFHLGSVSVGSYWVFLLLAFALAFAVRHTEQKRLGYVKDPRMRFVGPAALVGAVVGSKVGMLLFLPLSQLSELGAHMSDLDFSGKTVIGALAGGYAAVELAKKLVGISVSTGDGFAVALPLSQAVGRIGCFFEGCCYGKPSSAAWAVTFPDGVARQPSQLFEAVLVLALGAALFAVRKTPRPAGVLFRMYLVGYALIRFAVEFTRGDPAVEWGPLRAAQWVCLAAAVGFAVVVFRATRAEGIPSPSGRGLG